MDLLKIALVVITFSGLYLFMMVHDIENPYIKADVSMPRNFEAEFQWNDSYFEGMGKTQETFDHLENDDTFQDLFNFDSDHAEEIKPTSKPTFRLKSNFRQRRNVSKSVRDSKTKTQLHRRGNSDSRNVSLSQLDSQRQSSPIDSRLSSSNLRKSSDSERQSEALKSINDQPPTSLGEELERTKKHAPNLQMEPKEKEQQSETVNLRNYETKQTENSLYLPQDRETPKKGQIPESQTSFHQRKIEKVPSSSHTKNSPTDRAIQEIGLDKSQENLNFRSLAENQSLDLKDKSGRKTYDGNSKRFMSQPKSLNIHDQNNSTLNKSQKARTNYEQDSSKVALNHQGKITNNRQHSNTLPKTSSKKARSDSEQDSIKVASNHQVNPPPKITDNKQHSNPLPKTSSEKSRSNSKQDSSKVASSHQGKAPPEIIDNEEQFDLHPKTSSEKRKSLLIFGDDRSGTTFLTKMFAADPQMFTVYEPLWVTKKWFSQLPIRELKKIQYTREVVNALLSCQFTRSKAGKTFLGSTSSSWVDKAVFEKNVFRTHPFARKTTSGQTTWPNLYQNPEFAEEVCLNKFNHSVVKVGQVRVPTDSISVFIPDVFLSNPDTDIRIIQIVRDPRGSINSRIKAGWISDFTYTGFSALVGRMCSKIEANIRFVRRLESAAIKERYMEINYKEITSMPITTAKKIYKFAGFDMPDSLIDWIVQSTNPDERKLEQALNNPFSHVRDARNNYLKWRSESPIKRVRVIEERCKGLLDLLGLDAVADEMETLCS